MTPQYYQSPQKLNGLYGITDPLLLPECQLMEGVQAALKGGAKLIQYRNKQAGEIERLREASSIVDLCKQYEALSIINDDVQLALRVGADGVHLGKQDGDIHATRKVLGTEKVLGVTCHSDITYAEQAHKLGADYCAFGRLYDSQTKPSAPPCSLDTLVAAAQSNIKTVGIGGITLENAPSVLATGVDMLAVIHGLFGQNDIERQARSFSSLFRIHS